MDIRDEEGDDFIEEIFEGRFLFSPDDFDLLANIVSDDFNLSNIQGDQVFADPIDYNQYLADNNNENVLINDVLWNVNNIIEISDDEDDVEMIEEDLRLVSVNDAVEINRVEPNLVPLNEGSGVDWSVHDQLAPGYIADFEYPPTWFDDNNLNVTNEILPPYDTTLGNGQARFYVIDDSDQNMRGFGHIANTDPTAESVESADSVIRQESLQTAEAPTANVSDDATHNEFKFIEIVSESRLVERWLRSFSKRSTTARFINVNTIEDLAEAFNELASYVRNSKC